MLFVHQGEVALQQTAVVPVLADQQIIICSRTMKRQAFTRNRQRGRIDRLHGQQKRVKRDISVQNPRSAAEEQTHAGAGRLNGHHSGNVGIVGEERSVMASVLAHDLQHIARLSAPDKKRRCLLRQRRVLDIEVWSCIICCAWPDRRQLLRQWASSLHPLLPVGRADFAMGIGELQGIQHAQGFINTAAQGESLITQWRTTPLGSIRNRPRRAMLPGCSMP